MFLLSAETIRNSPFFICSLDPITQSHAQLCSGILGIFLWPQILPQFMYLADPIDLPLLTSRPTLIILSQLPPLPVNPGAFPSRETGKLATGRFTSYCSSRSNPHPHTLFYCRTPLVITFITLKIFSCHLPPTHSITAASNT